ncbi:MAG: pilus assembly PilX family protein [Rhodanobacter sp.]
MRTRRHITVRNAAQRGAILIMCLIFLSVLTLMALTGMDTSVTEERMAGNMQDYNQAFEAAEVAMEDAEAWLAAQIELPSASAIGAAEVWTEDGPDPDTDADSWWDERSAAWWTANAESSVGLDQVASQPQYLIEEYFVSTAGQSLSIGTGEVSQTRVLHRITSRGVGSSGTSEVMLQSTYIRPYD